MIGIFKTLGLIGVVLAAAGLLASNGDFEKTLRPEILIEKDGKMRAVVDFAEIGSRLLPVYEDDFGNLRQALKFSNATLSVNENTELFNYVFLPPYYEIKRRESSTGLYDFKTVDIKVYFDPDAGDPVWDSENTSNLLHVFGWFEGKTFTVHKMFSGNGLKNPTYQIFQIPEFEGGIEGVPAVVAFEKGEAVHVVPDRKRMDLYALPPSEEGLNRVRRMDKNELRRVFRVIARSGNADWFQSLELDRYATHRAILDELKDKLLLDAARNGRNKMVEFLLDAGAKANANVSRKARTYLSDGVYYLDFLDRSLLSNCVEYGHTELFISCFERISDSGVRVKKINELFENALRTKNFNIAVWLRTKGATMDSRRKASVSYGVQRCLEAGEVELGKWICESTDRRVSKLTFSNGATPMHAVAPYADAEVLDWLREEGVPLGKRDERGLTPLMIAAGYNNVPAVCWLVENGSNINLENNSGHTPLQYSIVKQKSETAACLIGYGADVNRVGPFGVTPLMQAILFRDSEIAEAIISKGGFWNFDSEYLDGTLEIAVSMDYSNAIKSALDQGLGTSHLVYDKWPLAWLANYFDSEGVSSLFDPVDQIEGSLIEEDQNSLAVRSFDHDEVDRFEFSPDLPGEVSLRCMVEPSGKARLTKVETALPRFRENHIKKIVASFEFDRSSIGKLDSWIQVEFRLLMDDFKLGFPRDILVNSIRVMPESSLPRLLASVQ